MFQVPSILNHHEIFLEELRKRLDTWETKQIIGDVFLDVVCFWINKSYIIVEGNLFNNLVFLAPLFIITVTVSVVINKT